MELITMVAYHSCHLAEEFAWRCVVCERLTALSEADIRPHLKEVHGMAPPNLHLDNDGNFYMYPDKPVK